MKMVDFCLLNKYYGQYTIEGMKVRQTSWLERVLKNFLFSSIVSFTLLSFSSSPSSSITAGICLCERIIVKQQVQEIVCRACTFEVTQRSYIKGLRAF